MVYHIYCLQNENDFCELRTTCVLIIIMEVCICIRNTYLFKCLFMDILFIFYFIFLYISLNNHQ